MNVSDINDNDNPHGIRAPYTIIPCLSSSSINDGYTGIGGKRSQVSGNFPASYTWNGTSSDSKAGNILDPDNHNGNITFDTDAAILMFVAPF